MSEVMAGVAAILPCNQPDLGDEPGLPASARHQRATGRLTLRCGPGSAASGLRVVLLVLGPVPLEVPARHRLDVFAACALAALLPLGLAAPLLAPPPGP